MTDVRRTLLAPHVAGKRVHGPTGSIVDADWPAVLSPATHELLTARLNDPARRVGVQTGKRHGRRYILTGLVRCALCGQPLVGRKRKGKAWAYFCSSGAGGCGQLAVVGWQVDDLVMAKVSAREHQSQDEVPPDDSPEREDLLRQLGELEARLAAIDADYADGTINGQELRSAKASVEERRQTVQARLGQLISSSPAPGLDWETLLAEGQDWHDRLVAGDLTPAEAAESRDWVAAWVDEVIVQPAAKRGARFDPKRVRIRWR